MILFSYSKCSKSLNKYSLTKDYLTRRVNALRIIGYEIIENPTIFSYVHHWLMLSASGVVLYCFDTYASSSVRSYGGPWCNAASTATSH